MKVKAPAIFLTTNLLFTCRCVFLIILFNLLHLYFENANNNAFESKSKTRRSFISIKNVDVLLILQWKHALLSSLEASPQDASNEHQQHMFLLRNKKKVSNFCTPLNWYCDQNVNFHDLLLCTKARLIMCH